MLLWLFPAAALRAPFVSYTNSFARSSRDTADTIAPAWGRQPDEMPRCRSAFPQSKLELIYSSPSPVLFSGFIQGPRQKADDVLDCCLSQLTYVCFSTARETERERESGRSTGQAAGFRSISWCRLLCTPHSVVCTQSRFYIFIACAYTWPALETSIGCSCQ